MAWWNAISDSSEKSLQYVYAALKDEHYGVRRKAVMLLLDLENPASIPYLEQVLHDKDFETRFYAKLAINRMKTGNKR